MKVTLFLSFIIYVAHSQSYVILDSCPPGCECFERNTAIECKEAHLTEIPQLKFASEVKRLVLRGNAIEHVKEEDLKTYPNLERLDLSDNDISTMSGRIFSKNHHLKEINLGLNPFLCDCDLRDFSNLLHSYKNSGSVVLKDSDIMQCVGPAALVGKVLLNVVFQDEYNKKMAKERMYIGEANNRGVAICPKSPKRRAKFEKLQSKPVTTSTTRPTPPRRKKKDSSPNIALIVASIMAAVLVTCIALATGIKYFLKKMGLQSPPWTHRTPPPPQSNAETFSDLLRNQRRASQGYPVSECSSDETVTKTKPSTDKTYFKAKLQNQRRQSQGYTRMHATSGSASDLEDVELE